MRIVGFNQLTEKSVSIIAIEEEFCQDEIVISVFRYNVEKQSIYDRGIEACLGKRGKEFIKCETYETSLMVEYKELLPYVIDEAIRGELDVTVQSNDDLEGE